VFPSTVCQSETVVAGAHSGEQLCVLRAIEVIENIDTADSRRLLERLAGGATGTPMTRHVQAALSRRTAANLTQA
jgi:hypothetical protein